MIAVTSVSLSCGRKPAVLLAGGIAFGAIIWCLGLTLGLSHIFEIAPQTQHIISLLGGAYLIYLGKKGLQAARAARNDPIAQACQTASLSEFQAWLRGFPIRVRGQSS